MLSQPSLISPASDKLQALLPCDFRSVLAKHMDINVSIHVRNRLQFESFKLLIDFFLIGSDVLSVKMLQSMTNALFYHYLPS